VRGWGQRWAWATKEKDLGYLERESGCVGEGDHTLGCVAGFVVFCEPFEVLVFNPRHPCFVLLVVVLGGVLAV